MAGSAGHSVVAECDVSAGRVATAKRDVAAGRRVASGALPLGRRAPRGRERWYLATCPEGRERTTCERVRKIIPPELLKDAFVPRKEVVKKFRGEWVTVERDLLPGHLVAVTADAPALARALSQLAFPVQLTGAVGRGYAPVDADTQAFLLSVMDSSHTIRQSVGEVVGGKLRVWSGPLAGREARVSGWRRRKSLAYVELGDPRAGVFTLFMPLAITARR